MTLKERRLELNLTQRQVAEGSGVSEFQISLFENGKGNPTVGTLKKICDVLGLRIEFVENETIQD